MTTRKFSLLLMIVPEFLGTRNKILHLNKLFIPFLITPFYPAAVTSLIHLTPLN